MGNIYSAAQKVAVWLGSINTNDMYLRVVLGAMQFHFSDRNSSMVRLFDYMCSVVDIVNQQAVEVSDSADCILDALHSIVDRPWFSRIWV
jgi:thioester reductase-like protein